MKDCECECKDKKLTQAVEIRGKDIHATSLRTRQVFCV